MNYKLYILMILFSFGLKAQQIPMYNHSLVNQMVFNPSYTGSSEFINAFLTRNQRFTGFGVAGVSDYLTVDGALINEKIGFGLQLGHFSQGMQQQLSAGVNYAYGLNLRQNREFRMGISAGYEDYRLSTSSFVVANENDPFLFDLRPKASAMNLNLGFSYTTEKINIGLALPQLAGPKVKYDRNNTMNFYRVERHVFLSGQYFHYLNRRTVLKPTIYSRWAPGAPLQFDLLTQIERYNVGWASLGYKSNYGIQLNVGVIFKEHFRIGYSFEVLVGKMRQYSSGLHHEVFIGFHFGQEGERGKTVVKIEEKVVEKRVPDPATEREKARLEDENERLRAEIDRLKDKNKDLESDKKELKTEVKELEKEVAKIPDIPDVKAPETKDTSDASKPPLEKLAIAKGYYFVDFSGSDEPDGFYVITGVFASKQFADSKLARMKTMYPESYMVVNKRNGYYYVIIHYGTDQQTAKDIFDNYKNNVDEKAWMLNYVKPEF
jgi:type IX secretion system PorP/SprF family membrane protein